MIKVMHIEIIDGKMEAEEVNLKFFKPEDIIAHIEDTCGHTPAMTDVVVDERNDDYITVTVSNVDLGEGEELELLFIGKREDWTGEVMN